MYSYSDEQTRITTTMKAKYEELTNLQLPTKFGKAIYTKNTLQTPILRLLVLFFIGMGIGVVLGSLKNPRA